MNHKLSLGVFGDTFVSNLNVNVANNSLFMNIWKSGLLVGKVNNEKKIFHSGWLLNVVYFSFASDYKNFSLFNLKNSYMKIISIIIMPELYAELNVAIWMKFKTGLAYSLYSFENQTTIKKSNLRMLL
ncbi:MAG: hypothetical protein P1P88_13770 [Bacteroidales bacterium]|nr:hypothetical protein [Bacteroidales bacterium]